AHGEGIGLSSPSSGIAATLNAASPEVSGPRWIAEPIPVLEEEALLVLEREMEKAYVALAAAESAEASSATTPPETGNFAIGADSSSLNAENAEPVPSVAEPLPTMTPESKIQEASPASPELALVVESEAEKEEPERMVPAVADSVASSEPV